MAEVNYLAHSDQRNFLGPSQLTARIYSGTPLNPPVRAFILIWPLYRLSIIFRSSVPADK